MRSDLSKVSIGIKSFLRQDLLLKATQGIRKTLPECTVLIADDSGEGILQHIDLDFSRHHKISVMSFDSGFGAKNNRIAEMLDTPYLLIGSDDFDFTPEAALGVEQMVGILEFYKDIDIVSGRVNHRPYEFNLLDEGSVVTEVSAGIPEDLLPFKIWYPCELTVNYSLIRREVLEVVHWDDEAVIGQGEHASFFIDVKRAGFKVAYASGVNINEQDHIPSSRYIQYRNRARSAERSCFVKRGVKRYVLASGQVDYNE